MKDGKDFRLPLSVAALDILAGLKGVGSDFVFPGQQGRAPLSAMACEQIMRRLKAKPATVHGFRTSFRSWVAERTDAPDWVAERCLAHAVGSAVERAYQRSDVLERRRSLMEEWSRFIDAEVVENGERIS